ncbi:hypothetical protein AYI68_g4657 [Smittium mucronatum]|uniref:Uncharacterized protein n=1 Tax=Smittium mucronatum TaxID=133383 RepID=A0A1R0GWH0_9FUNG|nr:hypothetical protein AYI68_g4657 [Smittium mucronatum]
MITPPRNSIISKSGAQSIPRDHHLRNHQSLSFGNNLSIIVPDHKHNQKKQISSNKPSKSQSSSTPKNSKNISPKCKSRNSGNNSREKRSHSDQTLAHINSETSSSNSDSNHDLSDRSGLLKTPQRGRAKSNKSWKKQRETSLSDDFQSFSVDYLRKPSRDNKEIKSLTKNKIVILKRDGSNIPISSSPKSKTSPAQGNKNKPISVDSAIKFASKKVVFHPKPSAPNASLPSHSPTSSQNPIHASHSYPNVERLIPPQMEKVLDSFPFDFADHSHSGSRGFPHYAGACFNNSSPDARSLPPPSFLPPSEDSLLMTGVRSHKSNFNSLGSIPPNAVKLNSNSVSASKPLASNNPVVNLSSVFLALGLSAENSRSGNSSVLDPNYSIRNLTSARINPSRSDVQSVFA